MRNALKKTPLYYKLTENTVKAFTENNYDTYRLP